MRKDKTRGGSAIVRRASKTNKGNIMMKIKITVIDKNDELVLALFYDSEKVKSLKKIFGEQVVNTMAQKIKEGKKVNIEII